MNNLKEITFANKNFKINYQILIKEDDKSLEKLINEKIRLDFVQISSSWNTYMTLIKYYGVNIFLIIIKR